MRLTSRLVWSPSHQHTPLVSLMTLWIEPSGWDNGGSLYWYFYAFISFHSPFVSLVMLCSRSCDWSTSCFCNVQPTVRCSTCVWSPAPTSLLFTCFLFSSLPLSAPFRFVRSFLLVFLCHEPVSCFKGTIYRFKNDLQATNIDVVRKKSSFYTTQTSPDWDHLFIPDLILVCIQLCVLF